MTITFFFSTTGSELLYEENKMKLQEDKKWKRIKTGHHLAKFYTPVLRKMSDYKRELALHDLTDLSEIESKWISDMKKGVKNSEYEEKMNLKLSLLGKAINSFFPPEPENNDPGWKT